MTSLANPGPNGSKVRQGWPTHQLGDAYEGHIEDPVSEEPDALQSLQRLQSSSTKGTGRSVNSVNSVVSVSSVKHDCIGLSQRRAVFRLARHLKRAHPELPSEDVLRQHWERDALLRSVPWDDFRLMVIEGWGKVRHPHGTGPLAEALAEADRTPVQVERYSNPQIRRLVGLCAVLQKRAGDKPFPLAASAVAEELNISQPTVSGWLRLLVLDKVLVVVSKGRTGKATEYRFLGVQG